MAIFPDIASDYGSSKQSVPKLRKVQGDSNKSEQLGRAISQAVQEELARQRLPGGLLL